MYNVFYESGCLTDSAECSCPSFGDVTASFTWIKNNNLFGVIQSAAQSISGAFSMIVVPEMVGEVPTWNNKTFSVDMQDPADVIKIVKEVLNLQNALGTKRKDFADVGHAIGRLAKNLVPTNTSAANST